MLKKAIISGIIFSSILLVGCNGESEVVVLDDSKNEVNDENSSPESNFLSELHNEIIVSITEQTELDRDSMAISLGGNFNEMSVSVGFPKDSKVDEPLIQQIVEDSIQKVSQTENVEVSGEKIAITIEKY